MITVPYFELYFTLFLIISTFFLTWTISSFWLSIKCFIRKRKYKGIINLLVISVIFFISVWIDHLFLVSNFQQGIICQAFLSILAAYIFIKISRSSKLSDRNYSILLSLSFLMGMILIMQPVAYYGWLRVISNSNRMYLQRTRNKFEFIMNSEKELLQKKASEIAGDQTLKDLMSQKDVNALHDYINKTKSDKDIDIITIEIPGLPSINNLNDGTNINSILGISSNQQSGVVLKRWNNELFNFIVSSDVIDEDTEEIGEITIGLSLDSHYWDDLKSNLILDFQVVHSDGVYYRSDDSLVLPYSFDIYEIPDFHYQVIISPNYPEIMMTIPMDKESPSIGSIIFESETFGFIEIARSVVFAQLALSCNIIIILLTFKKKKKESTS